ncbi:hypothetical protein TVAG_332580 [Trichomonas vaginalis G3]|uniref:Leucine Rich Repeat family protein n=1 Tax=Trichomonas vaginalis (strain ATCC PRA-98 / G3) TaxID=412133 RepID=A2FAD1_TRIV3|nr:ribonuclease inhibitor domain-containing protein [Trichomonas vaginalis G3]EAX98148.1 hypothetical protein TVAG_332580 [Trichomonas vaginalis G3]KAI5484864.1 ribonuclease inhibitor domain-containing protein [Trichomonas vaginalis G3]|eukprot:XP_001311078.1 hypothetical protein [Trichomonas vaginalis G3]
MTFVPLRSDLIQKILELRNDPSENKQWVGEVNYVVEGKKEQRYLLLTECCLYLMTKTFIKGNFEISQIESIFDILDASCNKDELTLKFKNATYQFILPESASLMTLIYTQYRYLLYQINVNTLPGVQYIPAADKIEQPTKRPPNILLHRYISASISKKTEIEKPVVQILSAYDQNPRKSFTFKNFDLVNSAAVFFALSMEGQIRYLIFDNFTPQTLGQIVSWVLTAANRFFAVTFRNYETANFEGLANRRSPHNHVNTVNLYNCKSEFVTNLISHLKAATYSLESLVIQTMEFSESLSKNFVNALQNFAIFNNLSCLAFIDCKSTTGLIDFSLEVIRSKPTLRSLNMESCNIDVCQMLIELGRSQSQIQCLVLRKNFGKTTMSIDEAISHSLLQVDVGECDWTADALTAFFTAICRWTRKMPLALIVDGCKPTKIWSQVFSSLPIESFRPVITELNLSNNLFDSRTFEKLLRFIDTQSPLLSNSQTKLMHLAINHCFKEFDVESCLDQLIKFFTVRELWGLEICDTTDSQKTDILTKFISSLTEIPRLTSLSISGNVFSNSAARALANFIQESLSIAELCLDKTGIKESDQLVWIYDLLLSSTHILSFNRPIEDLVPIAHFNEVKKINQKLAMKRQLSTTNQRLSLFLSLSGDFATRVPRPIEMDSDELIPEQQNTSELLFEQNFVNPVPSLFTLASLNSIDMSVDPLASMVTEYIATSGRYGIVPPTAPPPEAPKTQFALPVIFSTMQLQDEVDPDADDLDFDPNETDLTEISALLGAKLKEDAPQLSVMRPAPKWTDRKTMMTIPLVEFTAE